MTAQSMERILINGTLHYMASEPLEQYLSMLVDAPEFNSPNTACWRGYFGEWLIQDEKLYLTEFTGYISTPEDEYKPVDLSYLFPDEKKVFAEWFTGEIRIPSGKLVQYVHMGYESVYQNDIFIEFLNGKVLSKIEVENN